jgi:hypothetical protein
MTFGKQDLSSLDDDQFERMLFDSARRDEPAADVEAFWARLNTTINAVSQLSAASASAGGGLAFGGRLYRAVAAKWLILGVIAGSAVTALTLTGVRWHRAPVSRQQIVAPRNAAISMPDSTAEPVQHAAPPLADPPSPSGASARAPVRRTASGRASGRSNRPNVVARSQPDSALGAQVALLDAAQTAVAAGMSGEALRLADQYRADYPNGELAPEAEVVAIEALAARADRAALAARAARFLARYPSDPHAARVQWLAR